MVSIKRKVKLKTKIPLEDIKIIGNSNEEPTGEPPTPPQKSNTLKFIVGIIAIAAAIAAIFFFINKNNTENGNKELAQAEVAERVDTTKTQANAQPQTTNAESSENQQASTDNQDAETPEKSSAANDESVTTEPNTARARHNATVDSTSTTAETSTSPTESVETTARQVIRGDYGNGQVRKDKLGKAYIEVQGKVNDMYRQGLVR